MGAFFGSALLLILLSPASVAQLQPGNASCKFYDPFVVRLHGTLVSKTLQPDSAGDHTGGSAETVWLLKLDSPLCVYEDKKTLSHYPSQQNLQQVEVVVSQDMAMQRALLADHKVVATGKLSAPPTVHRYYARVLLTATSIDLAPK
jgi:hypothetical protein